MAEGLIYGLNEADRDNYRFTCGDCHILALRLHRLTGWDLCTFADEDEEPRLHAFVRLPDGRILDVNGVQTETEFRAHWQADDQIVSWTPAALRASTWFCPPTFGNYSYQKARVIADRLLDNLTPQE